jgi:hypothetical protein
LARIVLKSDFDGVVGAMLLRSVLQIDDIVFTHPEDIWSGAFVFNETDYVLNLPITQPVSAQFTGHLYPDGATSDEGSINLSCVQQILEAYPKIAENLEAVIWAKAVTDLNGSALIHTEFGDLDFRLQMAILVDPLTGMGKRKDFLKSNYYFLLDFIETGLRRSEIDWHDDLDFQDRIHYYVNELPNYYAFLMNHAYRRASTIIVDKREVEKVPLGNRLSVFKVYDAPYALYLYQGKEDGVVVVAGVASPLRTRNCHLGLVFSSLGGYGDDVYGTLQLDEEALEETLEKLLAMLC